MSDVQPTNGTPEEKRDATLGARRLLAVLLSIILGGITVTFLILVALRAPLMDTIPISSVEIPLLPLATLPMALFYLIWIDYFMGTKIVVD